MPLSAQLSAGCPVSANTHVSGIGSWFASGVGLFSSALSQSGKSVGAVSVHRVFQESMESLLNSTNRLTRLLILG